MTSTAAIMIKWTDSILSSLDPLIRISKQTGVATQYIQEMGYAATVTGSSISAVEKTVMSLSRKIGSAALNGNADFSRLGISVRKSNGELKSADEVLTEIAAKFKSLKLSLAERVTIGESLGVDSSLIELLGKTGKKIKELREESKGFGILTKEQIAQVDSYNRSVAKLRFNFDGLKRIIAVGLAPELEKLANKFDEFLIDNQDLIVEWSKTFAEGVKEAIKLLGRLKLPLLAIGTILTVSIAPTAIAITAAIAALAVVVDDLSMPLRGGKSEIIENKGTAISTVAGGLVGSYIYNSVKKLFSSSGANIENNTVINATSTESKKLGEDIKKIVGEVIEEKMSIADVQLEGGGQ